jgi:ATPase subunit of ABC transporter with duplicated ATPase domains
VPSLHLRGLSYAHTIATSVLTGVDLDVAADEHAHGSSWVGVVGANGSGKTTLLRLLAGEVPPTAGAIDVHSDLPPRLVPQEVDEAASDVHAFAADWDGASLRLRRRLALDVDDLDPVVGRGWSALSPGLRKRWQVAAALAARPDVLLLDEPTNHLDAGSRELLLSELERFRGLGLVVSHDRLVLERLTSRTLRVHAGGIELHAGPYGAASARWAAAAAAGRREHDRARREVRRERRLLADVRRDRHGAEAGPRGDRRRAGAGQPDAREAGRKFAAQKAEAALARRVGQQHARLERAAAGLDAVEVTRDHTGPVTFSHRPTGRRVLAAVRGVVCHAGGEVLLEDVDVVLGRRDRVHLAGGNGAGKTSLLHALLEDLVASGRTAALLPQELADPGAVLASVRRLDPDRRGRLLGTLATLGVDPDRLLASDDLSPGEARKLALAHLLLDEASVLVLDEPTNHLDLPSIERLQEALAGWAGALLLVTHDDGLAAATTSTRWIVRDGTVRTSGGDDREPGPNGPWR